MSRPDILCPFCPMGGPNERIPRMMEGDDFEPSPHCDKCLLLKLYIRENQ